MGSSYVSRAARLSLLLTLLLAGCASTQPMTTPTPSHAFSYLALGDSYTIGESVPAAARWPQQLVEALRAEGLALAEPEIVARTGWTTDELLAALEGRELAAHYDLISLLIGVNNQFRGYPLESYRAEFRQLLHFALEKAGGDPARVLVLSIPDWGATPFAAGRDRAAIAAEIDAFNAVAAEECAAAGVLFIDITPGSRRAPVAPELITGDGLHPSGALYAEWVAAVLPSALAALSR